MILIQDKKDLLEYEKQLEDFEISYIEAFPDLNEREELLDIYKRLTLEEESNDLPVKSFIILHPFEERFGGGLIVDYYTNSKIIHLIYLVVNHEIRQLGIAKKILKEDLPAAIEILETRLKINFNAIVFESNNPILTTIDNFDTELRLSIFKKLGAKLIPIDYIQPPLDRGKKNVNNLFLLLLQQNEKDALTKTILVDFLIELYQGLGIGDPKKDNDFNTMLNSIQAMTSENIELQEIPTIDNDNFKFRRVSLSFQLIVDDYENSSFEDICTFFHSYETDLLSFRFQRERPFQTSFIQNIGVIPVEIHFPKSYTYLSEGVSTTVQSKRRTIKANLHPNLSKVENSSTVIFNVVFSNDVNDYFSESEIIKLLNFVGSKQENVNLKDQIYFSRSGTDEKYELEEFLSKIINISQSMNLRNGIIQFDTSTIDFQSADDEFNWTSFYNHLRLGLHNETEAQMKLELLYNNNEIFNKFCNLLCGFSLGIFDYNRMGFDEVMDTLKPIKSNENYMLLKVRGILLNMCHEDEMYENCISSVGISPYFIVPNMVITYNEYQLENAFKLLKATITEAGDNIKYPSFKLRLIRNKADEIMQFHQIPCVFQYKTEKDIFKFSTSEHGLDYLLDNVKNKLSTIDHLIGEKESQREANSELFITILLTLLSCFQFQGIFESLLNNDHLLSWIYTTTFSFTVAFLIFYINKLKKKE